MIIKLYDSYQNLSLLNFMFFELCIDIFCNYYQQIWTLKCCK